MTPPEPVDKDPAATATPPAAEYAVGPVSALAQRGRDAVREGSQRLRDGAWDTNQNTLRYIQTEPVKAMLIAGAVGAGLMALAGLLSRTHSSR